MKNVTLYEALAKELSISVNKSEALIQQLKQGESVSINYLAPNEEIKVASEPPFMYPSVAPKNAWQINKVTVLTAVKSIASSNVVIDEVLEKTGLTSKFLAESVFEMTPKTLTKYRTENLKLPTYTKEIAAELIELYRVSELVFSSPALFNSWLFEPSYGLNEQIPATLLSSSTGISMIANELINIAFGATA